MEKASGQKNTDTTQERRGMTHNIKKLEQDLLEQLNSIAIAGNLEFHTFPPPEFFARELARYVLGLIQEAEIEVRLDELEVIHQKLGDAEGDFSFTKDTRIAALRAEQGEEAKT